jgi:stalled ribosome alternative rescue factor ArfA
MKINESAVKHELRTPKFRMRVGKKLKGKGSFKRDKRVEI